jgi:predicted protein tyrosine phosphatase
MIEVYPNLFVGTQIDYERMPAADRRSWRIVQAAREPYHRRALGYRGQGAPKDHREYLIALRDNHLILNLLDSERPEWIRSEIMEGAVEFMRDSLAAGHHVFVHCNLGASRSPGIAMLYLHRHTTELPQDFGAALTTFKKLYPPFNPNTGIREYLRRAWGNSNQVRASGQTSP